MDSIDRNAPLANTVATAAACAPLGEYSWTITNLATGNSYTFSGPAGARPAGSRSGEAAVAGGTYDLPLIDWNACGGQLCNFRVTLTVTDGCNRYATDVALSLLPSQTTLREVYTYTGSDQAIVVPTCASKALVKAWGAGGGCQSSSSRHGGGAGGYTEAVLAVTPGDPLTVVVGQGPIGTNVAVAYGFAAGSGDGTGGGLSGLFTGHDKVLHMHNSRALLIAGGGGGGDYAGTAMSRGGNGNDPQYSGGQNTMQGSMDNLEPYPARTYCGSGGGGYQGGGRHSRDSVQGGATTLPYGGEGGSGFVVAGATRIKLLSTPDGSNVAPNTTDPDYQPGVAVGASPGIRDGQGGHGLVVIYWQTA